MRSLSIGLVILSACVSSAPLAHPDTNDDGKADSGTGQVIRKLTGDATTIRADWSAIEAGMVYETVRDGSPQMPAIVPEHFAGSAGIQLAVPTDDSGHKERIEYKLARATDPDGLHFDNARYSGFALLVPNDAAPFRNSSIFWQAWQGYPYGPPVSLKLVTSSGPVFRIKLAIRDATVGPDSSVPDIEVWSGTLEAGTWHTFLIYVKPRWAGGGALKMWIDGTKVVDWTGAFGYDPSAVAGAYDGLDLKNGIYQPNANNGHAFVFDQIVVATGYAAAAGELGW
jgi:hypothetical protein